MQDRNTEIIFGLDLPKIIFYSAMMLFAVIMLIHYMRSEKPVKTALTGMISGTAALIALNFFGESIGLALPLNGFTAFIALTLGAPGVAAMCIISIIL